MSIKHGIILIGLFLQSSVIVAQQAEDTGFNIGEKLPPKVRALLIQEMNAVHGATVKILSALVKGESDIVAVNAKAIHDSFIMQQKMTEEDKKALLNTVPVEFVEQDRDFHQLSAELAKAAREENHIQQVKYFSEMIDACVVCHTRFAVGRFPGLDSGAGSPANQ